MRPSQGSGPCVFWHTFSENSTGKIDTQDSREQWTDLNCVGIRSPVGWCPGRLVLKAPRASTLIESAFGLLRSTSGLAQTLMDQLPD